MNIELKGVNQQCDFSIKYFLFYFIKTMFFANIIMLCEKKEENFYVKTIKNMEKRSLK